MEFGNVILSVDMGVNEFIHPLIAALNEAGIRAYRSFDLQSACTPQHSPCPHHGTIPCSCQLVVFMVYDWHGNHHSLILNGYEGQCEIALDETDGYMTGHIADTIRLLIETAVIGSRV